MKAGRRKLLIGLAVVVLLLGGGLFYVFSQLDHIVARVIETQGSAATGTDVRVGGVSIRLREASGEISRLVVANPDGFRGTALELGNFSIDIDGSTVTSDPIVINEVIVREARVNVLQQGTANNLKALLDNLSGDAPAEPQAEEPAGPQIVIERFVLENATASVSLPDLDDERQVDVPTITLTDIGRATNGATARQAARQILTPVLERVLRSTAAQSFRDRAQEEIDEAKDRLLEGLSEQLGGGQDENEDEGQ